MSDTPQTLNFGEPWSPVFRNSARTSNGYDHGFIDAFQKRAIECVNACAGMASPAIEIDRLKGVNAEMLEVLEEIARLPVARMYPDGPCIERHDMNSVRAAIAKAKGAK